MDIRAFRKKHNLTQQKLSEYLGVSNISLSKWESGQAKPRKAHIEKLKNMKLNEELSSVPFRPIQYLGSKLQLLHSIENHIKDITLGSNICDLFCGSGVVSNYLSESYKVVACDVQEYSSNIAKSLLTYSEVSQLELQKLEDFIELRFKNLTSSTKALIEYEEYVLVEAQKNKTELLKNFSMNSSLYVNAINPEQLEHQCRKLKKLIDEESSNHELLFNQIYYLYGSVYFSYKQSLTIDFIRQYIHRSELTSKQSELLLSCLLCVASDIVNTVGKQFAQPMKLINKDGEIKKLQLNRTIQNKKMCVLERFKQALDNFKNNQKNKVNSKHEVYCQSVFNFLDDYNGRIDCFYADPPYTIDHYSRFYHVLETITLYDSPILATMNKRGAAEIMNGLYRTDRHQSDFCVPSLVKGAFEKLFSKCRKHNAPLIVSYSPFDNSNNERPRLMTQEELVNLASKYYSSVSVHNVSEHTHRKLHSNKNNVNEIKTSEIFLICEL